jgi:hypothetical protein
MALSDGWTTETMAIHQRTLCLTTMARTCAQLKYQDFYSLLNLRSAMTSAKRDSNSLPYDMHPPFVPMMVRHRALLKLL